MSGAPGTPELVEAAPTRRRPRRRGRRLRGLLGLVAAVVLVVSAITLVVGTSARQRADDPRSTTHAGAGALGVLLTQEGVQLRTTDQVAKALANGVGGSTLVVADPEVLSPAEASRLLAAGPARLILLRPATPALRAFGVRAAVGPAVGGTFEPGCGLTAATRAGSISVHDARASYRPTGPADVLCYPMGPGAAFVRARTAAGGSVDLVGGGVSNADLGSAGNASFALAEFGSQPRVVWLMATPAEQAGGRAGPPTLLPGWWEVAVAQAFLALVVLGVWRGRRLGPILTEPLPVTVRAAETLEGHGRLYHRLRARDRAAEALRRGARQRLGRRFGHPDDPTALSAALATRTPAAAATLLQLIAGPAPGTDEELLELARDLERLEQEARR